MIRLMATRNASVIFLCSVLLCLLTGCAGVPHLNPLPEEFGNVSQIPHIPRARFWGDASPAFAAQVLGQPREKLRNDLPALFGKPHHYLALSGGGTNGAYGAGLLVGWTPPAPAIDPDAERSIRQMSEYLGSLTAFGVQVDK